MSKADVTFAEHEQRVRDKGTMIIVVAGLAWFSKTALQRMRAEYQMYSVCSISNIDHDSNRSNVVSIQFPRPHKGSSC